MSTIHFNQTTTLTPGQDVAGLTDFGPGRSEVFSKSADDYLEVHSVGAAECGLGSVGKGVLRRGFGNSIEALEARNNGSMTNLTVRAGS